MDDSSFLSDEPNGSTAHDMLRFVNALLRNRLLSPDTTATVTTEKVDTLFGGYAYGFAIFAGPDGEAETLGHIGAIPYTISAVEFSPPIGYTVIVLAPDGFAFIEPALIAYQKAIGMSYYRVELN
jgi:CubicO group peptidase (beta-lactamase class C family)